MNQRKLFSSGEQVYSKPFTPVIDFISNFLECEAFLFYSPPLSYVLISLVMQSCEQLELFIKVTSSSAIYVKIICPLWNAPAMKCSADCGAEMLLTLQVAILTPIKCNMLSVLGNITLWRGVWTNTIASNLLGSKKKELSVPDVLRSHIWRTSGLFWGGSSKIVQKDWWGWAGVKAVPWLPQDRCSCSETD